MWTDGSRYRIELAGHPKLDKTYHELLSRMAYDLFNKRPRELWVHGGALRFRLQNKEAFLALTSLGLPSGKEKAKIVTIPKPIINEGWECIKYAIRGIFDTDGTIFFSKKTYDRPIYPSIEISTISKELAQQLKGQLSKHGFRVHLRLYHHPIYEPQYKVGVYGIKMLELWFKEIGSSNDKHKDKARRYKTLYKDIASNILI